jgi:HK97 family phage major capsid protein
MGKQIKTWDSDIGRWATVQIDKSTRYWEKIKELVAEGKLFFSSGALGRFRQVDKQGNIERWPWVELTGTTEPANPYAVTMPAAGKHYKTAGLKFKPPEEDAQEAQPSVPADTEGGDTGGEYKEIKATMDENMEKSIAEAVASAFATRDATAAKIKADAEAAEKEAAERKAEIDAAVKEQLQGVLADKKLTHPAAEKKATIFVASKYDSMDDVSLDILATITGKRGWSEPLRNALADRFGGKGLVDTRGSSDEDFDGMAVKAVAAMDLTDTANWVPTAWSSELWRKLRLENKVAGLFRHIDLPANSWVLPTESTDPTIYKVAEWTGTGTPALSSGPAASQSADTKITLSTNKLGALVWLSGELVEDNAFPLIPLVRDQMGRKMEDAIEYVILSGDTDTTSANVSVATPGATDKTVLDNGLRKYALVTASGQGTSVGTLTFDDLVAIRYLLGKEGVDPKNLAWICDYSTYLKRLLSIDEFMTLDKYGAGATVLSGELGKIMSSPLIVSENLDKTGTNGKIISAGTVGSILCVARDRWICGWRRHFKFWQQYYGNVDATQLVVMARFCFAGFNETDGTDVALGYNVTL